MTDRRKRHAVDFGIVASRRALAYRVKTSCGVIQTVTSERTGMVDFPAVPT